MKHCELDALAGGSDSSLGLVNRIPPTIEVFRVGHSLVHRRTGLVQSPAGERRLRAKELELLMHLYDHVTATFTR